MPSAQLSGTSTLTLHSRCARSHRDEAGPGASTWAETIPGTVSATHEIGEARETAARASDRATENTSKLWGISLNSLLPGSATHQIGEFRDRAGEALTLLGASVGARRAARPRLPHQAVAEDQVRPSEGGRDTISRNRLFSVYRRLRARPVGDECRAQRLRNSPAATISPLKRPDTSSP